MASRTPIQKAKRKTRSKWTRLLERAKAENLTAEVFARVAIKRASCGFCAMYWDQGCGECPLQHYFDNECNELVDACDEAGTRKEQIAVCRSVLKANREAKERSNG